MQDTIIPLRGLVCASLGTTWEVSSRSEKTHLVGEIVHVW